MTPELALVVVGHAVGATHRSQDEFALRGTRTTRHALTVHVTLLLGQTRHAAARVATYKRNDKHKTVQLACRTYSVDTECNVNGRIPYRLILSYHNIGRHK